MKKFLMVVLLIGVSSVVTGCTVEELIELILGDFLGDAEPVVDRSE